ncbi:MAG: hypothetical protein V3S32_06425 [Acidimicrobiia bacterium]
MDSWSPTAQIPNNHRPLRRNTSWFFLGIDVLIGQHAANIATIKTGWSELGLDLSTPFEA